VTEKVICGYWVIYKIGGRQCKKKNTMKNGLRTKCPDIARNKENSDAA
jgi:hypothetical protein